MTSTLTPAPARRPAAARERTFDVELTGHDPAALVRILTTLRRRQCVVNRVDYRVADLHGPGWLTITLTPPRAHGHAVGAWLANLVDVAAVRSRS
ncbi:MAG TPA: hypothetical protein VNT55_17320 [Baekduia sp.]|nr:hypothetical protein [Baekduia sp.]